MIGTRSVRGAAITVLSAGVMLVIGGTPAMAAVLTVTTTQDETNPTDGQCSLREAVEQGNSPGAPGDPACGKASSGGPNTIALGPHDYHLTIPPTVFDFDHGDLKLSSIRTLTIQGAGPGLTTIDATGLGDRAVYGVAGGSAGLKDLTVTGGHAMDGTKGTTGSAGTAMVSGGDGGGGVAGENGGGIENFGTLTLNDVVVTGNHAGNGGVGGDGGQGGDSVSSRGGNGGQGGSGGSGGGIYNEGGLTVIDSTVSSNYARNAGAGGLGGPAGTPAGYYAGNGGAAGCCGDGGGIASVGSSATMTVIGSTITGNFAGNGGDGGSGGGYPDMIGTYQGGNGDNGAAGSWGGGISDVSGTISVRNSTITANQSGNGGQGGPGGLSWAGNCGGCRLYPGFPGAYGAGGDGGGLRITLPKAAVLRNLTITRNATGINTDPSRLTPGQGGGIWEQSPATLQNTLLASNGAGGNCATNSGTVSSQFVDGGHNLSFGDSSCPSSFANGDPRLGGLRGNGGVTQTIAIKAGSAARDRVPATGAHCPAVDQRGVRRPSGSACDIGAYELAPPKISVGRVTRVTPTRATVSDVLRSNQAVASAYFQFGPGRAYGSRTSVRHVSGLPPTHLSATFTALRPDTTYHYRLVASSADGTSRGLDQMFTTRPIAPVISSLRVDTSLYRIAYSDSEAATTTLTVGRCQNRHCTRRTHVETTSHRDRAGANTVRLPVLPAGRYRLAAVPRIGALAGKPRVVVFVVGHA
ncbi:MAG: choice-of-anchor Q domain-containing protein [Solirubrobacteraceae bacterium]